MCTVGISAALALGFWNLVEAGIATIPNTIMAFLNFAMLTFLVYNIFAGGNPPKKTTAEARPRRTINNLRQPLPLELASCVFSVAAHLDAETKSVRKGKGCDCMHLVVYVGKHGTYLLPLKQLIPFLQHVCPRKLPGHWMLLLFGALSSHWVLLKTVTW